MDLGNDDFWDIRKSLEIAEKAGLLHLLHMRKHSLVPAVDIIGYMRVPPTPFAIKDGERADSENEFAMTVQGASRKGLFSGLGNIYTDYISLNPQDTIEADLTRLEKEIDRSFVFVSHCPPFETGIDTLYSGLPAGSRAIRKFIEKWSGRHLISRSLHGHIHESAGIVRVGNATCVNPGQMGGMLATYTWEYTGTSPEMQERIERILGRSEIDAIMRDPGMDDFPRRSNN